MIDDNFLWMKWRCLCCMARGALLAEEYHGGGEFYELTVGFARFGGGIQDKASTLKGGEKGAYRHNLLSIVQNDLLPYFVEM